MKPAIIKYQFFILILSGSITLGCLMNNSLEKKKLISSAILSELHLHPKATLIDIYKFFFQDEFGPAHLIDNPGTAEKFIKEELADTTVYDKVLYQQLGYKHKFIRVNLSLVRDSAITLERLINAFIKSVNKAKFISANEWKKEWNFILKVIEEMKLSIPGFDNDKIFIDKMFKERKLVVHHSEIFIKSYNPHYRLISAELINDLM